MSICVFGIFVADLCFFANDIPIPGQTILGKKYIIGPGGKGSNQAIAAARAGGNVSFISKVGKDSYADLAISLYEKDKICLLYTSPSPRDLSTSRMPSSA